MDFYKNIDKLSDYVGVTYNQVTDVQRAAVVTEPVTLSEAKDFAKVSGSTDDAIITALITAAREICEKFTGVSMVQRTITAWFNNYNGGTYLPYGPVTAITGVYDADGNSIDYEAQGGDFRQILSPRTTLKAIYTGGAATCPEIFKTAIKAQVVFMFENRGDSPEAMSPISIMLLKPYQQNV
jgi:hypothetical protein